LLQASQKTGGIMQRSADHGCTHKSYAVLVIK
jgi:hypothetical protein